MTAPLPALYFDGRSAQARVVLLARQGDELLACAGDESRDAVLARWPVSAVRWPERTRHGQRIVRLPDGGELTIADAAAFDRWRSEHGAREGWVVRAQQHWRATLAATAMLVALLVAAYAWGVPWAARGVVALLPGGVDQAIGTAAMSSIRDRWLKPSGIDPRRQAALRTRFADLMRKSDFAATPWELRFHAAGDALGANAFALPGGVIVVTDELVTLLAGHDDTMMGVLGHEWGHLRHRHGMRALAQVALLGLATSAVIGDFSSVAAGVPALLGQLGYSRDAEREADAESVRVLQAGGISPAVMTVLFEKLRSRHRSADVPLALASHPMDDERIAYFLKAAGAANPR